MKQGIILISLLLALGACAAKHDPQTVCNEMFIILPDNYVIDLAAGATVILDPAVQEFAIFCTRTEAQAALEGHAQALPGAWRIYTLKGEFTEVAKPDGKGKYSLAKPAEVGDWVEL